MMEWRGHLALAHASAAACASACCSNSTKAVPLSFFVPLSCTNLAADTHIITTNITNQVCSLCTGEARPA